MAPCYGKSIAGRALKKLRGILKDAMPKTTPKSSSHPRTS
jgi:hypothetical protein